jgi:protein-tyrosine-phosphatase
MKVLFVCWANVGRSQMAAELYNKMTGTNDASSAGTEVSRPGKTLQERRSRRGGTFVIDVMQDEGVDVSRNIRTQLTEGMLDEYDLIINMAQPEYTPAWLKNHSKYTYWFIEDPGGKGLEASRRAKEEIKDRLKALLAQ